MLDEQMVQAESFPPWGLTPFIRGSEGFCCSGFVMLYCDVDRNVSFSAILSLFRVNVKHFAEELHEFVLCANVLEYHHMELIVFKNIIMEYHVGVKFPMFSERPDCKG